MNQREADLESLESQQAALAGQAALSTITVVVRGSVTGVKKVVVPPKPAPPGGRGGIHRGTGQRLGCGAAHRPRSAEPVVGTLIPFLPMVAVVAIGFFFWYRRIRRTSAPVFATQPGDPRPTE